jgi:hypothetical protein
LTQILHKTIFQYKNLCKFVKFVSISLNFYVNLPCAE